MGGIGIKEKHTQNILYMKKTTQKKKLNNKLKGLRFVL